MKSLTIPAELAEIEKVRIFLKEILEPFNLSEEDFFRIELSLVEVCTNIMLYAYPREKGEISIETWAEENKIFLAVKDRGIPFDPTTIKMPSIKEIITNAGRGGLGIFLAQKLMNGFHYRREDDQNILTLSRIIRKA